MYPEVVAAFVMALYDFFLPHFLSSLTCLFPYTKLALTLFGLLQYFTQRDFPTVYSPLCLWETRIVFHWVNTAHGQHHFVIKAYQSCGMLVGLRCSFQCTHHAQLISINWILIVKNDNWYWVKVPINKGILFWSLWVPIQDGASPIA